MKRLLALGLLSLTLGTSLKAQVTERPRPVECRMFRFGVAIFCRLLMGSIICMCAVGPNVRPKDTCFGGTRLYFML